MTHSPSSETAAASTPQIPDRIDSVGLWGPPEDGPTGGIAVAPRRKRKPWGLADVGWAVIAIFASQIVTMPVLVLLALAQYDIALNSPTAADELTAAVTKVTLSGPGLIVALCSQWLVFMGMPALASYRKGHRSLPKDFGFRFKKSDLPIGLGLALTLQIFMAGVSWGLSQTSLDRSGADNTTMITDQAGLMLLLMIFAACVAAPVTEELFFRGLILRGFLRTVARVDHAPPLPGLTEHLHPADVSPAHRRWGVGFSVLVSSLFFGMMHFPVATPDHPVTVAAQIILVSQTGFLGLVFAVIAVRTRRIGLGIVAHLFFNSTSIAMVFLLG